MKKKYFFLILAIFLFFCTFCLNSDENKSYSRCISLFYSFDRNNNILKLEWNNSNPYEKFYVFKKTEYANDYIMVSDKDGVTGNFFITSLDDNINAFFVVCKTPEIKKLPDDVYIFSINEDDDEYVGKYKKLRNCEYTESNLICIKLFNELNNNLNMYANYNKKKNDEYITYNIENNTDKDKNTVIENKKDDIIKNDTNNKNNLNKDNINNNNIKKDNTDINKKIIKDEKINGKNDVVNDDIDKSNNDGIEKENIENSSKENDNNTNKINNEDEKIKEDFSNNENKNNSVDKDIVVNENNQKKQYNCEDEILKILSSDSNKDGFDDITKKRINGLFWIDNNKFTIIEYLGVKLEIPEMSTLDDSFIYIKPLNINEIMTTPTDILNITYPIGSNEQQGYEIYLNGENNSKFLNAIKLSIKYDFRKLRSSTRNRDVSIHYYDMLKKQWEVLLNNKVDFRQNYVSAITDHLCQMFAGVSIKNMTPEKNTDNKEQVKYIIEPGKNKIRLFNSEIYDFYTVNGVIDDYSVDLSKKSIANKEKLSFGLANKIHFDEFKVINNFIKVYSVDDNKKTKLIFNDNFCIKSKDIYDSYKKNNDFVFYY